MPTEMELHIFVGHGSKNTLVFVGGIWYNFSHSVDIRSKRGEK